MIISFQNNIKKKNILKSWVDDFGGLKRIWIFMVNMMSYEGSEKWN